MQKNQGLYADSVEHMCLYQEMVDGFHGYNRERDVTAFIDDGVDPEEE